MLLFEPRWTLQEGLIDFVVAVVRHGLREFEQSTAKAWYDEAEGLVRCFDRSPS